MSEASRLAGIGVQGIDASMEQAEDLVPLATRVPRALRDRFARMAREIGVSQQFLIQHWMFAAVDEYDKIMRHRWAQQAVDRVVARYEKEGTE